MGTVSARSCGCSVMWQRRFNLTAAAEEPALINAEKVWAFITIQELLLDARREQATIASDATSRTNKAKERSIEMALQYQFVTPYTSIVTVADESQTTTTTVAATTNTNPMSTTAAHAGTTVVNSDGNIGFEDNSAGRGVVTMGRLQPAYDYGGESDAATLLVSSLHVVVVLLFFAQI